MRVLKCLVVLVIVGWPHGPNPIFADRDREGSQKQAYLSLSVMKALVSTTGLSFRHPAVEFSNL
jgi:hypothetical protein